MLSTLVWEGGIYVGRKRGTEWELGREVGRKRGIDEGGRDGGREREDGKE